MAINISPGPQTDSDLSLLVKPACTVVAAANLTLSAEQTIDGITTVNSLVLATAQSTGAQNGPWVTSSGAWARPGWYSSGSTSQAPQFLTTFIRLGTTYQGSTWRMTTANVAIDTTSTTWAQTPIAIGNLSSSNINIAGTATNLGGSINIDTITGVSSNGLIRRIGANSLNTVNVPASGKFLTSDGSNWLASIPSLPTASAISGKIMQSDGTNWIASPATHPTAATLSKVVIGDGTNYVESIPAFPNASAIAGKFIRSDGTNWIASTPTLPTTAGTNGNYLRSDGTNWLSTARLMQQQSGTSTSGTNGTVVASMTAGAGNQLVNFLAVADQTTAASTQTNINIVYSDGTFTTANSLPNQPVQIFVNYAGILVTQSAQFSALTALSAKKVTTINVTTQNTGVGTRGAIITAEEIPLS